MFRSIPAVTYPRIHILGAQQPEIYLLCPGRGEGGGGATQSKCSAETGGNCLMCKQYCSRP